MPKTFRPKTFCIKTYGCQMNHSDSERIVTVLQDAGLRPAKSLNTADVIIFNTCSVRQSAEDRILGLKKQMLRLKQLRNRKLPSYAKTSGGKPITVITGCMCKRSYDSSIKYTQDQESKYLRALKRRLPWADIIIDIKDITKLLKLLKLKQCNNEAMKPLGYLSIPQTHSSSVSTYVPISTGCNEFCTYCIVPYARGKQIDRPASEILREVRELVDKGYKDIMLLGQNINSWRNSKAHSSQPKAYSKTRNFLDLLKAIDNIKGDFWLSFLSSHPNYFTNELMNYCINSSNKGSKLIAEGRTLTAGSHLRPYLNLALQSGSNKILKRMNRKYTVEKFINICSKLKEKCPQLNLSTDIIVGFPQETEKDFKDTIKVMKELKFDMAYINKYSPRQGTAAATFEDNVSWKEKKRREKILTKVLTETALKNNKKYIGQKLRVLISKKSKKFAFGKTFNFKNIRIPLTIKSRVKTGEFIEARITKATSWGLEGETVKR